MYYDSGVQPRSIDTGSRFQIFHWRRKLGLTSDMRRIPNPIPFPRDFGIPVPFPNLKSRSRNKSRIGTRDSFYFCRPSNKCRKSFVIFKCSIKMTLKFWRKLILPIMMVPIFKKSFWQYALPLPIWWRGKFWSSSHRLGKGFPPIVSVPGKQFQKTGVFGT